MPQSVGRQELTRNESIIKQAIYVRPRPRNRLGSCHTWWKTTGCCDVFGVASCSFKRNYFLKNCPSVGDLFGRRSARKMNGTSQWRPPAGFCGRLLLLVPLTRHRVKADDVKRWRMARCCFFGLDLFLLVCLCFSSHSNAFHDVLPSKNESITALIGKFIIF